MDYSKETKKDLTSLAKEKGVDGYSKMSKAELVSALEALEAKEEVSQEPQKRLVFNPMLHRHEYR